MAIKDITEARDEGLEVSGVPERPFGVDAVGVDVGLVMAMSRLS